jgi:transketolase
MVVEYCINQAKENCMIRLVIGPSPRIITLPENYQLKYGCGIPLTSGDDAILFAYGPVMLHEALLAAEILRRKDFSLKVVNMPWLNRVNPDWLQDVIGSNPAIYVLEDHAPIGGLGDTILNALVAAKLLDGRQFKKIAVEGYPAWGTPPEVLQYHKLDGASLAKEISESLPKM